MFIHSFVFLRWGIKLRPFISDLPLPISKANSRLNYWLINTPYQFIDWWPWKAEGPEALRDQAKETVLNISNLVDSGSFLVNGSLRCLVAYLIMCSETDDNDRGAFLLQGSCFLCSLYMKKTPTPMFLKSCSTSNSTTPSTHAHTLTNLPACVPNMTYSSPTLLIIKIVSLQQKVQNVTWLSSLWPCVSFNTEGGIVLVNGRRGRSEHTSSWCFLGVFLWAVI